MAEKAKKEIRLAELRAAQGESEETEMIVEGYAIRFNEPYVFEIGGDEYREIIKPEALQGADMRDVPMKSDGHKNIVARTRNKTLELIPDSNGLFVRAKLADTTAGRDLYALVKRGDIYGMSFAFTAVKEKDHFDRATRTRTITGFKKIWDVAAVGEPAYDTTSISARDWFSAEAEAEKKAAEAEAEQRKALESAELRKRKLIAQTYL